MQVGDAEFLDFIWQSAADARQSAAKTRAVIEETRAMLDEPETEPKPPGKRGNLPASTEALAERGKDREEQMKLPKSSKPGGEKPTPDDGLTQSERFIKAAQVLGTDDDPERFAERVRKLAKVSATTPRKQS